VATFNGVTFNTAGSNYALTARDTTVSVSAPNSNTFTVNPGSASKLAFIQQPTNGTAGTVFAPSPTVQIEDQFGNHVAQSGTAITMAIASGPRPNFTNGSTTSVNTNASGLATFNNLSVSGRGTGTYTIRASSNGLTSVTSNSFTQ
jgi:hypothetical protein